MVKVMTEFVKDLGIMLAFGFAIGLGGGLGWALAGWVTG